jgi:hypothetical protein
MAVHIDEVHANVSMVDPGSLLSAAVLDQIVEAVVARLDARCRDRQARASELDLRSVVEQQRAARGGRDG